MQPKIFHASDHDIDPSQIDKDAIYVVRKLRDAGYSAYLVGGSVRDLLIKKTPKDFDISTSARPEQIKQVFNRNCILIGRRFRLAHIRFGHKIIEVSTFRSGDNESDLIVHDNIWGTPEEDVIRRDFTINGLFYDPFEHQVIDYVGGWEDIHKRTLRTIGNPVIRFKQDPVRMIRLIKFRARFGFKISEEALDALATCCHEIKKSSPARVLEELFRMLESGASERFFRLMVESGMLSLLFPELSNYMEGKFGETIYDLLCIADKINSKKELKTLDRSILAACLLFPMMEQEIKIAFLDEKIVPNYGQVLEIADNLIKRVILSSFSHFPRKISSTVQYILAAQYRLTPPSGKKHLRPKLLLHHEFDLALQFLKIRCLKDKSLVDSYNWWQHHHAQAHSANKPHVHGHSPHHHGRQRHHA